MKPLRESENIHRFASLLAQCACTAFIPGDMVLMVFSAITFLKKYPKPIPFHLAWGGGEGLLPTEAIFKNSTVRSKEDKFFVVYQSYDGF